MLISRPLPVAPLILAAALSGYACEDSEFRTAIGPSATPLDGAFVSRAVSVRPAFVDALAVEDFGCTSRRSFVAPFDLFVRTDGTSALSLNQVRMEFYDGGGIRGMTRTITRTELAGLFGSITVPPFGVRTFPFSLPLGCGFSGGAVNVVVFAIDSFGHESSTSLRIGVR
jgi:hypothetical protein